MRARIHGESPRCKCSWKLDVCIVCTTPGISHVSIVSRYMHHPGKGHWQAVKWILQYLRNLVDVGLTFEQDKSLGKCIIGYVILIMRVIWISDDL